MLNPFATSPAFSMASLTTGINRLPNNYGRLRELDVFPADGLTTRVALVEIEDGVLNLLQTQPWGSPGQTALHGGRTLRAFPVPHIPHDDSVMPEDVQGRRAFGEESQLESYARLMAKRLQSMRDKHAITLEYLRMGALKGVILDADGSTIFDLYTEFGIVQKSIDFLLGTASTDIKAKCLELSRHVEDNLKGETYSRIRVLVSEEFFDRLTSHAKVEAAYNRWMDGAALRDDMRGGFPFGGILFEEYRGKATLATGATVRFIAAGEGHAWPEGTMSSFRTHFAPADFEETVNTEGLELYAKQEPRKFGRGTDLHTQSNPLPLCRRPELLVRVHTSN